MQPSWCILAYEKGALAHPLKGWNRGSLFVFSIFYASPRKYFPYLSAARIAA